MALNKDGIEAGKPVDYATMRRIELSRKNKVVEDVQAKRPKTTAKKSTTKPE